MKIFISALLALSVLAAISGAASACDDCELPPTMCGEGY